MCGDVTILHGDGIIATRTPARRQRPTCQNIAPTSLHSTTHFIFGECTISAVSRHTRCFESPAGGLTVYSVYKRTSIPVISAEATSRPLLCSRVVNSQFVDDDGCAVTCDVPSLIAARLRCRGRRIVGSGTRYRSQVISAARSASPRGVPSPDRKTRQLDHYDLFTITESSAPLGGQEAAAAGDVRAAGFDGDVSAPTPTPTSPASLTPTPALTARRTFRKSASTCV
ncbi:hypothetical protein RR46_10533 [Papilio xuthus]|uniref:Uncharacterized protein n=1 Tax=Papilio xuthus TaxID=66420 RepID=A0A194PJR7_PAPXU|nr:hypothetical protein RR46_10533 [Papilio xuthus]